MSCYYGSEDIGLRKMTTNLTLFAKDLALRGLAATTQETIVGSVRRYQSWASTKSIEPEKSSRQDLLDYLGVLRARGLKQPSLLKNFSGLSTWFAFLEEIGQVPENPIPYIQHKYLKSYKDEIGQRKLISIEEASKMVSATIDTRDRAMLVLLLKTGIRRGELISLDVDDISLEGLTITLKPKAKRTNRIVFFDDETRGALARWLNQREMFGKSTKALFIAHDGMRLEKNGVRLAIEKAAERVGLHNPKSKRMEDRFSPHCCRHWFTTHLRRAGMSREFIQELRGDVRKEAIDIYDHIDAKELKESYLAHIPQLGI